MEKTVAVKLTARVAQYLTAMASASKATEGVATSASRSMQSVGSSMQSVGGSMTRYVSLPLVALGGAAAVMASRFETSFAQMVGLANVPAGEVDDLRESVLSLSGETAQAPQDLADALYFAASSGLDSAAAMEAVELAARGAATGMGSTSDIVGLITGAIGSYGEANLTAAEAADFLTATIREGRAAPDELAASMGRILPIAASMGISMGEVGGAIAYLTNQGLPADEAVTSLRDILSKLSDPGKAAKTALEDMGTSAGELKAAIDQNGLMGALELLRDHGFNGNAEALGALMPDIRGMNGLVALLNDSSGKLDETMGAVVDSTGSLDTAFEAVSTTSGFKMKQAIADIEVALIRVGDILLPFIATMAQGIGDLAEWFAKLPGPVQDLVVAFGGLAVVAGPIVFLVGSLIKNFQSINSVLKLSGGGVSSMAKSLGVLGAGIAAGLYIYDAFGQSQRDVHARTQEVSDALGEATTDAWHYAEAAAGAKGSVDPLTVAQLALSNALTGNTEDGQALTQALGALGLQTDDAWTAISGLNIATNEGTPDDYAQFWVDLGEQMGLTGDKLTLFSGVMGGTMPLTATQLEAAAKAAGFADGEFDRLVGGANDLIGASQLLGESGIATLADKFLNTASATSELGANLVTLARAQADATGEGENSVAVYENYLALLPGLTEEQQNLALGMGETTAAVEGANTAVGAAIPLWDSLWNVKPLGTFITGISDVKETIDQATGSVTTLAEAQAVLAAISLTPAGAGWVAYAEQFADASAKGEGALAVYQALQTVLNNSAPAFETYVRNQIGLNDQVGKVAGVASNAKGAVDELWRAYEKLGVAADAPTQDLSEMSQIADEAMDRFHRLADAADDLRTAFDMIHTPADDLRASVRGVYEQFDAMHDALGHTHNDFDEARGDWDGATEDGRTLQEQTEASRDAILEHGAAMMENGASARDAAADIAFNVAALNDQWRNAGLTEEQIAALNYQYGLTPEQVETALKTYGIERSNRIIDDYNKKLGEIPDEQGTTVTAHAAGTYGVEAKISNLARSRSAAITPYLTQKSLYVNIVGSGTGFLKSAAGRFIPGGSNIVTSTGEVGGSRGDEVILPLGDPARMSQLLGLSGVGSRVAAAFGGMGGGASSGAAAMSGGVYNYYMTVNMPPGSNGDDVVRAAKQWQRRNGPLPVAVR